MQDGSSNSGKVRVTLSTSEPSANAAKTKRERDGHERQDTHPSSLHFSRSSPLSIEVLGYLPSPLPSNCNACTVCMMQAAVATRLLLGTHVLGRIGLGAKLWLHVCTSAACACYTLVSASVSIAAGTICRKASGRASYRRHPPIHPSPRL